MRTRLVPLIVITAAVLASFVTPAAASADVVLAQQPATDEGQAPGDPVDDTDARQGSEQQAGDDGEGQGDPDAQSGAGEGEQGEATVEEGPVWTYQMARLGLVLLLLIGLGIGLAYYKLVAQRQRAGT